MSTSLMLGPPGMVCSVGHDLGTAYASVRAGIIRHRRLPIVGAGGAMLAAPVLPVVEGPRGASRLSTLLRPALEEALRGLPGELGRVGLALCEHSWAWVDMFQGRGALHADLLALREGSDVEPEILRRLQDVRATVVERKRFALGHASALAALAWLRGGLERQAIDTGLVVAVGSQVEPAVLAAMDQLGLTKSAQRPEGFVPGEAACVLTVGAVGCARVSALEVAERAPAPPSSDLHRMTEVLRGVSETRAVPARATLVSDRNGERWRAEELAIGLTRTLGADGIEVQNVEPALSYGDLGAVASAAGIAIALATALESGQPVLATASSRGPLAGALVVEGVASRAH